KGFAWLNMSYFGVLEGEALVTIQCPLSPARRSGVTSVNYSGPQKRVADAGWDALSYLALISFEASSAGFVGRKFQFWWYRVSHGELLVRSPKTLQESRNVDLMFVDVAYVDLPRFIPELEVVESNDDDVGRASERLGRAVEREQVFVLKCGD